MLVTSSTQHPSEVQHLVARVLGVPDAAVTVEVRRMGGGFGGKETQAGFVAATAALLARLTGRPVKLRLDRDDDFVLTGKRHDFRIDWRVGFDADGRIHAADIRQAARGGWATDLTPAICDRAMFHADNAYFFPAVRIVSERLRTHTQSATAFRGFGGPQGMLGGEVMLDAIARHLGLDPLDVRRRNLYGAPPRDLTPYHQSVHDNVLGELLDELEETAQYRARRRAIDAFNRQSPVLKRGLALTPVKFGISFTTTHLNQAGALLHLYTDGSLHLAHGGTEMGQGLHQKVIQLVADELQLDARRIRIAATSTAAVPNTSATAASSGTDLNGAAALAAARTLKARLTAFLADRHGLPAHAIVFRDGHIQAGTTLLTWAEAAKAAHAARVPLSATGFYATPEIHWDRARARGRPFLYFAYGAACAEVAIDTLSGETRLVRADLLHDVGRSLNPAIDRGQVEGGFVQGMGWLTSEELVWDERGRLRTHAPSTYKIPTASDVPADLRVGLWAKGRNVERVVGRSKAVGEPPLMLAIAVFIAIRDAIAACGDGRQSPRLDAPATPERVLAAVDEIRARSVQRRAAE
jgi:xanthine dehydrogenase large subunit